MFAVDAGEIKQAAAFQSIRWKSAEYLLQFNDKEWRGKLLCSLVVCCNISCHPPVFGKICHCFIFRDVWLRLLTSEYLTSLFWVQMETHAHIHHIYSCVWRKAGLLHTSMCLICAARQEKEGIGSFEWCSVKAACFTQVTPALSELEGCGKTQLQCWRDTWDSWINLLKETWKDLGNNQSIHWISSYFHSKSLTFTAFLCDLNIFGLFCARYLNLSPWGISCCYFGRLLTHRLL